MKNNKFNLKRLFSNTKFLLIFSFVVALIFWMIVSLEYSPVVENVIQNVPVNIDMKDSVPAKLGLEIFGVDDFSVDVQVKGNKITVGGDLISADDISVTAQTSYVNTAGNHMLQLTVAKADPNADFDIIGYSQDYIEVFFDKRTEKEFELIPELETSLDTLTDEDYLFNKEEVILKNTSVKLSGAQTEINKVVSAKAIIPVKEKLTQCVTFDADVHLESEENTELKYISINGNTSYKVPVTLPVYKIEDVKATVSFSNSPTQYLSSPLSYTVYPSHFEAAILQNGSNKGNSVNVGNIDFTKLTSSSEEISFSASDISDIKVLDSTDGFIVSLNLNGFSEKVITVSSDDITFSGNDDSDLKFEEKILLVKVIGPYQTLEKIDSKNITVAATVSENEITDSDNKVKLNVTVSDKSCWVYGEYYVHVSET